MPDSDERIYEALYRSCYQPIARHIKRNSGTEADARDIFQDGVIVIWSKRGQGTLKLTASICTFLYAICRNLWRKKLEHEGKLQKVELQGDEQFPDDGESTEENERELTRRQQIVQECLSGLSEKCRTILKFFYFDRLSMGDIAIKMGFANEDVAKKTKYDCIQKLRRCVEEKYAQE
jgi:RNA polymerase sigma factor (sigma-70 family)